MTTDVAQRLARLREDLLGGRGPGASADEVARHTRDRAFLGGMQGSRPLARVHDETEPARGEASTASTEKIVGRGGYEPAVWLLLGALGALGLRSLLHTDEKETPRAQPAIRSAVRHPRRRSARHDR